MRRWTDDLRRGDQIVNIYRSDAEQVKVLLDLLRWLNEEEKMLLLSDSWERPAFRYRVLDSAEEEGRLSVRPATGTFCPGGEFDPGAFLSFMTDALAQAGAEGYRHLLLVWEGNWVAAWPELTGEFLSFGCQLALARLPGELTTVRQYDSRIFSTDELDIQRRMNQMVLENGILDRCFWVVSTSSLDTKMKSVRAAPASSGMVGNEK